MKDNRDTRTRDLPGFPAPERALARRRGGKAAQRPLQWAEALGYESVRSVGPAGLCAVRSMLFTGALVVGITPDAYAGRYCYETLAEAAAALEGWDGVENPPGEWIKYKGVGGEQLGPGCSPAREH